jgi:hypothetical protein
MFRTLQRTFILYAAVLITLCTTGSAASVAQFPKPNIPTPNIPRPNIPTPNIPRPNIPTPNIPKPPNIPQPNLPKPPSIPPPNVPNPIEEAKKQAARVDELRKQAERVLRDFDRMKDEAEKAQREYDRLAKLARSNNLNGQEAIRTLKAAGGLRSNRDNVVKGIDSGLGVVVWGKEIDHIEEQKLAAALATSVATANPGPAVAMIKQFAAATKAEVLKSLRSAPGQVQQKAQREFEGLLVQGLNAAIKGQRPPGFGLDGIDLTVALATYNHWIDVRINQPRLVPTEKVLGVQLYRIATDPKTIQVPLPNTFQPYLKLAARTR